MLTILYVGTKVTLSKQFRKFFKDYFKKSGSNLFVVATAFYMVFLFILYRLE